MDDQLAEAITSVAQSRVLLAASDFDGTMSHLVTDPASALAHGPSIKALEDLAGLRDTHAAILSGRAREELGRLSGKPKGVLLIGSHGGETGEAEASAATAERAKLLQSLGEALDAIAARAPGLRVERKPMATALHWRGADEAAGEAAARAALEGPAKLPGVHVRAGSKVLELCVSDANKGAALRRLRTRVQATGVFFIGDDVTDEDAFGVLGADDLGVKVGAGVTRAAARVEGVESVGRVLEGLVRARRDWLATQG